jgi:hypothetical protein
MSKRVAALSVATALVGGVVVGAVVPASSQQTEAFTLCDQNRTGYERNIDVGREDFSPGDLFLFTDKLQNPRTGKGAARLVGKATYVKVRRRDALFIADITTIFPNGKISWYGSSWFESFRAGAKFVVTGGTGSYRGAQGSVIVENGRCRGKRGLRLTFNLAG